MPNQPSSEWKPNPIAAISISAIVSNVLLSSVGRYRAYNGFGYKGGYLIYLAGNIKRESRKLTNADVSMVVLREGFVAFQIRNIGADDVGHLGKSSNFIWTRLGGISI